MPIEIAELCIRPMVLDHIELIRREVDIADGEVLFRVDRFALTANNITYAAHGLT